MTKGSDDGVRKSCASVLDPQMDRLWVGEENKLWSHSWRASGGLFLAHIRPKTSHSWTLHT